ncbi:MAG: caspase family protein [Thermodesulfobacteriota bacterium]
MASALIKYIILTCLVLGLWPWGMHSAWAGKPALYALTVGVSKYKDTSIRPLKYAAEDALEMADFLKTIQEQRKLFSGFHISTLINEDATKARIQEALAGKLSAARKDDIVLIYFAGHGSLFWDDKYYFASYEADPHDLKATAVWMSNPDLFSGIKSERVLLIADSCQSGGYLSSLGGQDMRNSGELLGRLSTAHGRFGISAAGPNENALESPDYRRGLFTYYLMKGFRGAEAARKDKKAITVKSLFDYVYTNTKHEAKRMGGDQNPQLCATPGSENTPLYVTEPYTGPLNIRVKLFYEDQSNKLRELDDTSVLKSGQHLGFAIKPESDCYVHIFWIDSSGRMGRLLPNTELTEGTGFIKAGRAIWLPEKGGKHWYVLDKNPGIETIYLAASRYRNQKLESLYSVLEKMSPEERAGKDNVSNKIEREINLMDTVDTEALDDIKPDSGAQFLERWEKRLRIEGGEAFKKWQFKHVPAEPETRR